MSSSFYKMSEYVNTSLSPFSETEVYLYKQNLPMLPSESMMEIHHLIFAVIHFLIIFLQNISSTKSSPIVYFSQPMCLTQISFFHDEAMNAHVYPAVISLLRLARTCCQGDEFQGQVMHSSSRSVGQSVRCVWISCSDVR